MFRNYIRIAWRNLKQNPGYTFVNIIGLSIGIACFLLIFLYTRYEMSFDNYHEKKDRIYRIISYSGFGDDKDWGNYVSGDPIPELRNSFTQVEEAVKRKRCGPNQIVLDTEIIKDIEIQCSDSHIFDIFSFKVIKGEPETSLDRPNTAVITHSLARRLFGEQDPIGKTLPIYFGDATRDFEITALMEDVPSNSHFRFDLLLSYESLKSTNRCLACGQPMYVLLKPGADKEVVSEHILNHIREVDGKTYVEDVALQSLKEVHFGSISAEIKGDLKYIYILSGIALIILFIACANYMNLATSNYSRRAREIGIRKVLGGYRSQIMRQFLVETFVVTFLSLPAALLILYSAIPFFNGLTHADLSFSSVADIGALGSLFGVIVAVSLVAGSYPAFYLSSFEPVTVLKGKELHRSRSAYFRKGLVVVQFLVSIVMITLTFLVLRQFNYLQTKNMGIDTGQIVLVNISDPILTEKPDLLKLKFSQVAGVQNVTAGFGAPGVGYFGGAGYISRPEEDAPSIRFVTPAVDENFIGTYNLSLLAGRNISDQLSEAREKEALINQSGLQAMGWNDPQDALGHKIGHYKIVGVVPDFNFQPLHNEIKPLLMQQNWFGRARNLAIKIKSEDFSAVRANLEAAWNELDSLYPFEFSFLDDRLNQAYEQEKITAQVIGAFAGICIVIACMGLIGLASFMAERRTKEIGIRKTYGASVTSIVYLLLKDFGLLIGLSFLISIPLVYTIGKKWLEGFAYKVSLDSQLYAAGLLIILLLVVLSTGYQSVKAALKNPADVVRYE